MLRIKSNSGTLFIKATLIKVTSVDTLVADAVSLVRYSRFSRTKSFINGQQLHYAITFIVIAPLADASSPLRYDIARVITLFFARCAHLSYRGALTRRKIAHPFRYGHP